MSDHQRPLRVGRVVLSGLRARVVRGVSWNLIGTTFNQGSTFLVNIILANLWGLSKFGEYAIILSAITAVVYVAQLATGYTATRYVAEYRLADRTRAARVLGLGALVAGVTGGAATVALFLISSRLALAFGGAQLVTALRLAALGILPGVMNGFLMGALAGLESYPALGRAGMLNGVLYVVGGTAGGSVSGVNGAFAGMAVAAVVQSLVLGRALVSEAARQRIELRLSGAGAEASAISRFAVPAALNGFLYLSAVWVTNALLVRQPGGYSQAALFASANNFRTIALFVPAITNNVAMSLLNNQRGAGDERQYRRVFWTNLATTAAFVVAGACVMAAGGRLLLAMFGPGFPAGYPVLLVLLLAAVLETLVLATLHPLLTQDRVWEVSFAAMLPCYTTVVLMTLALAPAYGALGVASAYVTGWSVALLASISLVMRLGIWSHRVGPHLVNA